VGITTNEVGSESLALVDVRPKSCLTNVAHDESDGLFFVDEITDAGRTAISGSVPNE